MYAIKYIFFLVVLLTSQQNTSNPAGFQNVLTAPFWHGWRRFQKGTGNLLNLTFTEKEEFLGAWSSGATLATVTLEQGGSGSWEQSHISDSEPWTSTEQDCSVISLEEFQRGLSWRGVQESWLIFMDLLLQAQEWSLLVCKESTKGARRPAWTNKKILTELKYKRECTRITSMIQVIQKKQRHCLSMQWQG